MLWRHDGRQRSLTFENLPAAERFKTLLEDHGPNEALRIIELDEVGRRVPTVTEWLKETVFLTPAEFRLLRDHIGRDRWKNLAHLASDHRHALL